MNIFIFFFFNFYNFINLINVNRHGTNRVQQLEFVNSIINFSCVLRALNFKCCYIHLCLNYHVQ